MGLSYTEELVSEYFKHIMDNEVPKYIVCEHIQFQNPLASTKVKGWSDIDIVAIASDEICIIQTKSFAVFEQTVKESIDSTIDYFITAERFVRQRYDANGKTVRKIFIADYGLSKTFRKELPPVGIETESLKDIMKKYLLILASLYPDSKVGKEENNLTRILVFLLDKFDKEFTKGGLYE